MKNFLRWHLRDWFLVTLVWGITLANSGRITETYVTAADTIRNFRESRITIPKYTLTQRIPKV